MKTTGIFRGSREACRSFLYSAPNYYVYVLCRADGRPFYVGKGTRDRVFSHENEARHPNDRRSNAYKLNVIRSIWRTGSNLIYEIAFTSDDEEAAYRHEAELISGLKRLHEGGPLTNLAPGGGTTGEMAPASRERHSATLSGIPDNNPDRATLNGFVLSIAEMKSVVLKPVGQFTARPTQPFPRVTRKPSVRQAVALVASAAANGVSMDGACQIPRHVLVEDVAGLVENGVACDIATSGMATLVPSENPEDEIFSLDPRQSRVATDLVGVQKCVDLGVMN